VRDLLSFHPPKSVLKYEIGDEISLSEKSSTALFKAFLAEMEKKSS